MPENGVPYAADIDADVMPPPRVSPEQQLHALLRRWAGALRQQAQLGP